MGLKTGMSIRTVKADELKQLVIAEVHARRDQWIATTCVDLLVAPSKIEEAWETYRTYFEDE